ncbi:MAG: AAA family ATPase, partial [Varibaculum cambriense]|nr:AAA family ATPase [Varibaculum cambriense]
MAASSSLPVQILEGRRAVGKTTLLQNLTLANGERPEYFSFSTDRESLRAAKRDPQEWLSRLPNYSVIDEAQLLPDVTQHVKAVVDRVEDKHRFILCGSAGIGRSRPGEADWLTGRAQRLELLPFTASELAGRSLSDGYSLADALFYGDWAPAAEQSFASSDADLIAVLRYGGMPSLCIPGANPGIINLAQVNQQVFSENEMSLGRELVPGQAVDILRARALLDALLAYPGGILNKDRLANELKMDVRTVGRYLDILTERFLVYSLANFRGSAASVGRGAPKMHAVDTSTVCESLSRRGHDISSFPATAGQVLENWVANQIRAEIGWASTSYQLGYWRVRTGNRDDEVDLVLLNDTSGAVGVEVKLTSTPNSSDFRGLRRFREDCGKAGRKFRRGFVVCTCERVREIEDGMWAIPYQLLGDYPAPSPEELGKKPSVLASQNKSLVERISLKPTEVILAPGQKTGTESPAATIFVSYAHADNEPVYGGL